MMSELSSHISMEAPQIYSVLVSNAEKGAIVSWAEHGPSHGVSVTNKGLEEVRSCLLGLVVPNL